MKTLFTLILFITLNSCAINALYSDEEIILNVKRALAEDEDVSPFAISVSKKENIIILSGTVNTEIQKQIATQVTYEVEGVSEVDNHLFVKNPVGNPTN